MLEKRDNKNPSKMKRTHSLWKAVTKNEFIVYYVPNNKMYIDDHRKTLRSGCEIKA